MPTATPLHLELIAKSRAVQPISIAILLFAVIGYLSGSAAHAQSPPPSKQPEVRVNVEAPPQAPDDAGALAEKLQNPIADLISVPFQNNTNFNVGPQRGVQDILNIQPWFQYM